MLRIELPFPPSSLSGHTRWKGNWSNARAVKDYRQLAKEGAEAAAADTGYIAPDGKGDIRIAFTFVPPDNRGDRLNFANRVKPIADGIADAIGINDKRFLPSYHYRKPEKPGWVEIVIEEY